MLPIKHILVPIGGENCRFAAFQVADSLAREYDAQLVITTLCLCR